MNNHLTPEVPPIAATAPALALVASVAAKHPLLPAPYLVFSTHERSVSVGVQCPTLPAFEAWREALGADPASVTLFASMISVDLPSTVVAGGEVQMHLYAGGLPLVSERHRAEWEAFVASAVVETLPVDDEGPDDCISIPADWRAARQLQEDPHDSALHHDYAVGHDLPAFPRQQDRRAL